MKNKQEELQEKADFIRDSMREDGEVEIKQKDTLREEIERELNDIYNALANAGDEMGIASMVVSEAEERAEYLEKKLKELNINQNTK